MPAHSVSPLSSPLRCWLYRLHRWVGLLSLPFMLVSILLGIGLTHPDLLDAFSERIYLSQAIPDVALQEPVRVGSWDQAHELARQAVGQKGQVITLSGDHVAVVQAFEAHTHDPAVASRNRHVKVHVDLRDMRVIRITDRASSLVTQAHAVHAYHFFGISWLTVSMVTTVALAVLLLTGGLMVWLDGRRGVAYRAAVKWHVRVGRVSGLLLLVIVLTTLHLEFGVFGHDAPDASHPIPAVQPVGAVRPNSLDQARDLVRQATGAQPRAVFIRDGGRDTKFSEAGDGIGDQSVWMDMTTMRIHRMTDWRNDRQALNFILHDGRWLGGMNALNVNDVMALALLFLAVGGVGLGWRRRRGHG